MSRSGARCALPVLCVGNFVAGGAGKTPLAIEIARRLRDLGERPAFLTRGHGGSLAGPLLVAPGRRAGEVGDEALLLARHAPTVMARSRLAGARLAESSGASVIVMDDGLQNPSLVKDLSLAVVDAETGVGNRLCLPAGPLRAPLARQWPLVQAAVLVRGAEPSNRGIGESCEALARDARRGGLPVILGSLVPEASEALRGRKVVAFAGIGRPAKFFATLRSIGAVLVAERGFPDHHVFRKGELEALAAEARIKGAVLATTEKDMMRIGAGEAHRAEQAPSVADIPLHVLRVMLLIQDVEALDSLIAGALAARRHSSFPFPGAV